MLKLINLLYKSLYRKPSLEYYTVARHYEFVQGDLKSASKNYLIAAHKGFVEAQSNIGRCYQHGLGVSQNYRKARYWLKKAALANNVTAQYNLGVVYDHYFKDMDNALYWYIKAANNGEAKGAYNASDYYFELGDLNNWEKYAVKAVELGDLDALSMLRRNAPHIGNSMKINKTPRIFIGYSAQRSIFWNEFIKKRLIPYFKDNYYEYYNYQDSTVFDRNAIHGNIALWLSHSDLYISFIDKRTYFGAYERTPAKAGISYPNQNTLNEAKNEFFWLGDRIFQTIF